MFLQTLELTTALRPELLPDETLLFVQDAVGLYEGKFKIPNFQDGHAYLTSHRICYVDKTDPRQNSTAIELRDVERYEISARFLKSSPKITLYPLSKRSSFQSHNVINSIGSYGQSDGLSRSATASPLSNGGSPLRPSLPAIPSSRLQNTTWVCPICSLSNPVPSNFDPITANSHTPLPPCLACGIKPPLSLLLKATISNSFRHDSSSAATPTQALQEDGLQYNESGTANPVSLSDYSTAPAQQSSIRCPRCTFRNHPSLLTCEICDAPLSTNNSAPASLRSESSRAESPGPSLESTGRGLNPSPEYVKISFRAGGEKIFHERLRGAMIQRRWLLKNAPPIPQPNYNVTDSAGALANLHVGTGGHVVIERPRAVGIAGLERRGLELRKNNETVISNAFEDLEALMASAKEIIALAESFSNNSSNDSQEANEILKESAAALGMVTTKAMLGSNSGSDSLYISELSRSLAEYLTDDRRGTLRKEGGIMSLVDLWAVFNRASTGVELVYPPEFEKAAQMWEKLGLPVRLRKFRNGLMVVQRHDWTDDKCIAQLLAWLQDLRLSPTLEDAETNSHGFGRGVTAQDAAARFGWSVGVASEELEMAEEKGALCREESIEGLRFWENWLLNNLT